jgi:hypothetical protein
MLIPGLGSWQWIFFHRGPDPGSEGQKSTFSQILIRNTACQKDYLVEKGLHDGLMVAKKETCTRTANK